MGIIRRFFRRRRRFGRGRLFLLLAGVVVAGLSLTYCSSESDLETWTARYGPPVPVSEEAATSFFEKVARAGREGARTRSVSLTISEREATSALALGSEVAEVYQAMQTMTPEQLEAADPAQLRERVRRREARETDGSLGARISHALNPRIGLREAQVRFLADGRIVVSGWVYAWRWRQPALIVVAPRAERGEMELDFVEGRLGRLPAPEWLFDQTGKLLSSVILMGREYAEITALRVERGRLVLRGQVAS